jgi:hypothetical protein
VLLGLGAVFFFFFFFFFSSRSSSQAGFDGSALDRRYARMDKGTEMSLGVAEDLSTRGGAQLKRVQVRFCGWAVVVLTLVTFALVV